MSKYPESLNWNFPDKDINGEIVKREDIKYDLDGITYCTAKQYAKMIVNDIEWYKRINKINLRNIIDLTGGLGADLIAKALYGHFNKIIGIELDKNRYKLLEENLYLFKVNDKIKIYNDDSVKYIQTNPLNNFIYYIDPPFGGKEYINKEVIYPKDLKMGDTNIVQLCDMILKNSNVLIVMKLPFNTDIKTLLMECQKYDKCYSYYLYKKIIIVILYKK